MLTKPYPLPKGFVPSEELTEWYVPMIFNWQRLAMRTSITYTSYDVARKATYVVESTNTTPMPMPASLAYPGLGCY